MSQKSNPFGTSIYDSCSTETCKGKTQHKSGLCTNCRTKKCASCDDLFIASNPFDPQKPQCGYCKLKKKLVRKK